MLKHKAINRAISHTLNLCQHARRNGVPAHFARLAAIELNAARVANRRGDVAEANAALNAARNFVMIQRDDAPRYVEA